MTINSCFIYMVYTCTIFIFSQAIIPLILNLGAALHYYYINFFVSGVKRDRDISSMNEKSVLYNEKEYLHCGSF